MRHDLCAATCSFDYQVTPNVQVEYVYRSPQLPKLYEPKIAEVLALCRQGVYWIVALGITLMLYFACLINGW